MDSSRELHKILIDSQAIEDGHFSFRKDLHSRYLIYFDRVMEDVGATGKIVSMMFSLVRRLPVSVVITPNSVHGYALSVLLAAKFNAKAYRADRRGGVVSLPETLQVGPGTNVLLVDDGINTGNSMKQLAELLKERDAGVRGACVAVSRYQGALVELGVPVYTMLDLTREYWLKALDGCEECGKLTQVEERLSTDVSVEERMRLMKLKMRLMLRSAYVDSSASVNPGEDPIVLDCREELKRIRGAESSYERFHGLLHLKAECGLERIVECWNDLDNACRIAILDGLTAADAESISEFLAGMIKSSQDRDLVLRHLTHLPRILRLVQPVIDVHNHLDEDLRREVEWFLWSSATGEGSRFLGELAGRRSSDPRKRDPVGEVFRRRLFTKQNRGAIAEVAERFNSYHRPVDAYDVAAWLAQFESDADRMLMLRLLMHVEFISSGTIEEASTELWERLPDADRRTALLTGLGPVYKSGTHLLYEFRPGDQCGFSVARAACSYETAREAEPQPALLCPLPRGEAIRA